ncbi:MAG: tRNA lysidine(34) synthetase TilS [Bacteroidales bacterium]|nr:tRNA lysidine(34) synthetase TilS [Bacteroidales bacterium]
MLERFKEYIHQLDLCKPGERILIALSGGIDSMVLTHLFMEAGYNCSLVHCNFQLRGQESDEDESFVMSQARRLSLPLFVNKCDAMNHVQSEGVSVEMAARALRYKWFDRLMQSGNFDKLATGHNLNDDQETFFIKLFRGSGLAGIKGIPVQRKYIIRPLMFATREEIEAYAKEHHILHREDSTNAGDEYLRNRIRHHLLPFMDKEFPGSREALNATIEKLKEQESLFSNLIDEKRNQLIEQDADGFKIDKTTLPTISESLFFYILEPFGFARNQISNILSASLSNQTGQLFHSASHTLLCDRKYLFLKVREETTNQTFQLDSFINDPVNPIHLKVAVLDNYPGFSFENNPDIAYFDADKVELPLTLRHWKKGDTFVPFGMKGKKLLSDFFIDEKINRFEKEKKWLLVSGENIIWIIGHRSSDQFRVQKKTEKILKITHIRK